MSILSYEDMYNSKNNMRLREIFCEYDPKGILTLDRNGKEGKISLYKLFVAHTVDDPTEYTFAEQVFGDWLFWEALSESSFLKPRLEDWRRVTDVMRKKQAFAAVVQEAKEGKNQFSAAKYLIEEPWKGGPTAASKRKAKKKAQETAEEAFLDQALSQDIQRLREEGILN